MHLYARDTNLIENVITKCVDFFFFFFWGGGGGGTKIWIFFSYPNVL